ncbi:hypothetical protein FOCC_FOCC017845 [Frankliniella occidentalis]|uniref:Uncharacterized protein LOC113203970 isoform X2 n=1 Tax=Frankliniella occidentalis TaxID=133901 RepID=A0A6J1S6A5_FRAOC|nr:uncharacterized protein LOC113203970 isoform X2 [Frankliniella occidentalis]KAE8736702.1 hypothetical protein FOCC_FOCC017845 [Frankliniella occidentalis]
MCVRQPAPSKRHGDMLLCILALLLFLAMHPVCWSKRPSRPSLLQASRLVVEFPKLEACRNEPGNAIRYFNFQTRMISKTESSLNVDFNVTRSVQNVDTIMIQLTKCRESVSSNSCERFQNWRFENNPCKGWDDPNAIWSSALSHIKPRLSCPFKEGTYHVRNITTNTPLLEKLPLPWEGNVWLIRLGMLVTKTRYHVCAETEMRVHRVRAK